MNKQAIDLNAKAIQPLEDDIMILIARIHNFRSLRDVEVKLDGTTVLIGENNSGKTSFLEALYYAIGAGRRAFSEEDIFLTPAEKKVPRDRMVTIDLLIRPISSDGKVRDSFPEGSYWLSLWGKGVAQDENENDFVAIRTQMKWSVTKGEYDTERRFLLDWPDSANWDKARINESSGMVRASQIEPIALYFMDAKRDIQDELQNRGSFWHRLISDPGLTDEQIEEIEKDLSEINKQIVEGSNVLSHVQTHLNDIYKTLPCDEGSVAIAPLTRHVRDLSRGMDISFSTNGAQSFPLVKHGMGTRCLAALLIFRAYSVWRQHRKAQDQVHSMLALEEPEAHLHPQAQRALFVHIESTPGQRIISTHSPYIAGQADIGQFRYFKKNGAVTEISQIDVSKFEDEDVRKIKREVLNTRGDLLYARVLILCSGETEEQALPIYAEAYWGITPSGLGISFVGVGGDGKYAPFLNLASGLGIHWYICSDGEDSAIQHVSSALENIGINEISNQKNVFILPDKTNWEKYLVDQGYTDTIETVLNTTNGVEDFLDDYIQTMNGKKQHGNKVRDYSGKNGRNQAIIDVLMDGKTKYAAPLARAIISLKDDKRRIPKKIKELFDQVKSEIPLPNGSLGVK
jgi:Predicted ATP-dependent endonuclease of the OLD family